MPFEAAKAVAATFCYNIRYALVPIFTEDFLSLCVRPDSPRFGRMIIDKEITRRCTVAADELRLLSDARNSPLWASITPNTNSTTPRTPVGWFPRSLRPKGLRTDRTEVESGYGTDTDTSEIYSGSPVKLVGPGERGGPRVRLFQDSSTSLRTAPGRSPPFRDQPPNQEIPWQPIKTAAAVSALNEDLSRSKRSSSQIDGNYDIDDNQEIPPSPDAVVAPRRTFDHGIDEEGAAHLIMELHMADAALHDHQSKRHRDSL
jgi:hypothetical protein